jgi:hypothetical protein
MVSDEKSHSIDHIQAADMAAGWAVDLLIFSHGDADTAVQILHLFESDRKKIRAMGRKAASSLAVHEYRQAHPLTKIGPAAKDLKLSIPTVTSAPDTLIKLKTAEESTGKR